MCLCMLFLKRFNLSSGDENEYNGKNFLGSKTTLSVLSYRFLNFSNVPITVVTVILGKLPLRNKVKYAHY